MTIKNLAVLGAVSFLTACGGNSGSDDKVGPFTHNQCLKTQTDFDKHGVDFNLTTWIDDQACISNTSTADSTVILTEEKRVVEFGPQTEALEEEVEQQLELTLFKMLMQEAALLPARNTIFNDVWLSRLTDTQKQAYNTAKEQALGFNEIPYSRALDEVFDSSDLEEYFQLECSVTSVDPKGVIVGKSTVRQEIDADHKVDMISGAGDISNISCLVLLNGLNQQGKSLDQLVFGQDRKADARYAYAKKLELKWDAFSVIVNKKGEK